jgi:hypothetical protein
MLHKQHGKEKVMVLRSTQFHRENTIFWMSPLVDSKDEVDFAMLFTLKTTRKAGGLQILCCQGFAVAEYGFTLDALALKPSGFCNVRAYSRVFKDLSNKIFSPPGHKDTKIDCRKQ